MRSDNGIESVGSRERSHIVDHGLIEEMDNGKERG